MVSSLSELIVWQCCKCLKEFVDADEHPELKGKDRRFFKAADLPYHGVEPQEFWLSATEVVCNNCGQLMGLKEER